MAVCKRKHRYSPAYSKLPDDQGGAGRHRCVGCAYEAGQDEGSKRSESFEMNLDALDESQAGTVRHKSPHAAYAQGYLDGVVASYA